MPDVPVDPTFEHTEVAQVTIEQQARGEHIEIEGGDKQRRGITARRPHRVDRRARRTARAGALDDQFVHPPRDRDIGLAVEAMPARAVFGRTNAVALVPAAQRRGGYAEALSDDADRVQGFVRVAFSAFLKMVNPDRI